MEQNEEQESNLRNIPGEDFSNLGKKNNQKIEKWEKDEIKRFKNHAVKAWGALVMECQKNRTLLWAQRTKHNPYNKIPIQTEDQRY